VFAVSLNPISMNAEGALKVDPILKVAPGSGVRTLNAAPAAKWQQVTWPKER
jgi:hypothetical protein